MLWRVTGHNYLQTMNVSNLSTISSDVMFSTLPTDFVTVFRTADCSYTPWPGGPLPPCSSATLRRRRAAYLRSATVIFPSSLRQVTASVDDSYCYCYCSLLGLYCLIAAIGCEALILVRLAWYNFTAVGYRAFLPHTELTLHFTLNY